MFVPLSLEVRSPMRIKAMIMFMKIEGVTSVIDVMVEIYIEKRLKPDSQLQSRDDLWP